MTIALCAVILILCWKFLLLKRKKAVLIFRADILEKCIEHDNRHYSEFLCNTESSFFWCFAAMPSKNRMIYSTKPLELKYWFREEIIDKLLR